MTISNDFAFAIPNEVPEVRELTLGEVVCENIRLECARKDINQSELARQLGKGQSYVAMKWRGKRQWTLEDLTAVAEVLGVQPHELLVPDTRNGRQWVKVVKTPPAETGGEPYTAWDSNPEPAD